MCVRAHARARVCVCVCVSCMNESIVLCPLLSLPVSEYQRLIFGRITFIEYP